jgi:hypothetical protein
MKNTKLFSTDNAFVRAMRVAADVVIPKDYAESVSVTPYTNGRENGVRFTIFGPRYFMLPYDQHPCLIVTEYSNTDGFVVYEIQANEARDETTGLSERAWKEAHSCGAWNDTYRQAERAAAAYISDRIADLLFDPSND